LRAGEGALESIDEADALGHSTLAMLLGRRPMSE
jgi:hypothetical protein